MIRVTITRAETKNSAADAPNPWKKLGIQTNLHGDKWLGCFYPGAKFPNKTLAAALDAIKQGDTLDIIVTPSPDGKFLNFKLPAKTDLLESRLAVVEKKLGITGEQESPKDELNPDDIPF